MKLLRSLVAAAIFWWKLRGPRVGPRYRCTCCGTNEIDARAKGCPRGRSTCPMDFA